MNKLDTWNQDSIDSGDQGDQLINQISQYIQNPLENQKPYQNQQNDDKFLRYPQQHTYSFPIKLLKFQKLKGKDQFKSMLRDQAGETELDRAWRIYKYEPNQNQVSIYVRCLYCKAAIQYHQYKDKTWNLIKYKNNHIHSMEATKAYNLLARQAIFQNLHLSNAQLHETISKSYPMNRISVYQRKRNLLKKPKFELIIKLLKHLNYDYRYQHNIYDTQKESYPQTLVAVSPEQKLNYQKYGECVVFESSQDCVKQTTYSGKRYGLSIFSGFDNNKRLIIFGFSITTLSQISNIINSFRWFFDIMQSDITTAIITNPLKNIIYALKTLKNNQQYDFYHIYDNWYFIKIFISSLQNQNKEIIKQLTDKLATIMRESDPIIGELQLSELKKLMIKYELKKQYEKLQSKINHACLWKMPKKFVGLSLHSNEGVREILKIKQLHDCPLYHLIERLDKVTKRRNLKCQTRKQFEAYPFENFFDDVRIKELRYKFQKKIFNSFIFNYRKAKFYKLINSQQQESIYRIDHIIDKDQYIINNMECSCQASQKTGIPCQHLIFIFQFKFIEQSFVMLFNKRWLVPIEKKMVKKGGMNGRRKRSRRNHIS